MKNKSIVFIIVIVLLLVWNGILTAQFNNYKNSTVDNDKEKEINVTGIVTDLTKISNEVRSTSVSISSGNKLSSGFIYSSNNDSLYVVTCNHSLNDVDNILVTLDNELTFPATLLGTNSYLDLAVLRIDESIVLPEIKYADSDKLNDGEFLVCIGTPSSLEFKNSTNIAIVSSSLRTVLNSITINKEKIDYYQSYIQLSSNVDLGYSGAPCFNMNSELVGMIVMKSSSEVMALPINELKIATNKIIADEESNKLNLGIKGLFLADLENYDKTNIGINLEIVNGLYVSEVLSQSIAYDIGIISGDVIVSINDIEIKNNSDYLKAIYQNGEELNINVNRNNELITLKGELTND